EARAGEESVDAAKPLGETTLVILGKKAQSDETKKLEADRAEVEALRDRIARGDRPLEAHAELLEKLGNHIQELESRPDASDPLVADEIDLYKRQFQASQDT